MRSTVHSVLVWLVRTTWRHTVLLLHVGGPLDLEARRKKHADQNTFRFCLLILSLLSKTSRGLSDCVLTCKIASKRFRLLSSLNCLVSEQNLILGVWDVHVKEHDVVGSTTRSQLQVITLQKLNHEQLADQAAHESARAHVSAMSKMQTASIRGSELQAIVIRFRVTTKSLEAEAIELLWLLEIRLGHGHGDTSKGNMSVLGKNVASGEGVILHHLSVHGHCFLVSDNALASGEYFTYALKEGGISATLSRSCQVSTFWTGLRW